MQTQCDELAGYKKGDWVRFYCSGRLVIGQIEYLLSGPGGVNSASTDAGRVSIDAILECRPRK